MAKTSSLTEADKQDLQQASTTTVQPAQMSASELETLKSTNAELLRTVRELREARDANPLDARARFNEYYEKVRHGRTGEHRWQVRPPNQAYWDEYDCDYGPDKKAMAILSYEQELGTEIRDAIKDRFRFEYMGETKDLGPKKDISERMIPMKERIFTWKTPPKSLRDFMSRD